MEKGIGKLQSLPVSQFSYGDVILRLEGKGVNLDWVLSVLLPLSFLLPGTPKEWNATKKVKTALI